MCLDCEWSLHFLNWQVWNHFLPRINFLSNSVEGWGYFSWHDFTKCFFRLWFITCFCIPAFCPIQEGRWSKTLFFLFLVLIGILFILHTFLPVRLACLFLQSFVFLFQKWTKSSESQCNPRTSTPKSKKGLSELVSRKRKEKMLAAWNLRIAMAPSRHCAGKVGVRSQLDWWTDGQKGDLRANKGTYQRRNCAVILLPTIRMTKAFTQWLERGCVVLTGMFRWSSNPQQYKLTTQRW